MDFSFRNLFLVLFGIFFVAFALFWMSLASNMGAPSPFPYFGLIFVVAGIGIIIVGIRTIVKGPISFRNGPATYNDYMKAQEMAKEKENEDPNASRLSTEHKH